MAIKGSLREASLPDVLQLLALGRKTGCLSVTDRNNFGAIYFDQGTVCFASIVNRRDRLGDILVKRGQLRPEQLETAIALQARTPELRLGEILVREGMVTREVLAAHVRMQIEEAVYHLFTWAQGTFHFEPNVRPVEQDLLVSLAPDALLMEGARRIDEWSVIEKRIPTFDLVFDVDLDALGERGVALTAVQRRVAELLDGHRDVAAVVEESGQGEFEVGQALYGLLTAGFAHQVGRRAAAATVVPDGRLEEHRNLGVAFYRSGLLSEAHREFRRVLELRPADAAARFHVGLIQLRQAAWVEAANTFHEASAVRGAPGAVFHNLAYALERLGRLDEARAALEEAQRRGLADDPRVLTSLGVVLLAQGAWPEAEAALARARAVTGLPSPAWAHAAALAAALRGDHDRAAALLREGIAAAPHAAVLHATLAVVEERRGALAAAREAAERAVQEDPGLAQAHKVLGDVLARSGRREEALAAWASAAAAAPPAGPLASGGESSPPTGPR
jgi:Flp pilus assembly protein TadD